jgi:hypothetical protein
VERLETRELLSAADLFSSAIPITLDGGQPQIGIISQTPTYYAFSVAEDGRLIAEAAPTGGATRLSLFSSDGELLMQSDGQSPTNPIDLIDIHLAGAAGGRSYYLGVERLSDAVTTISMTTEFTAAAPPFQAIPVGEQPSAIVTGDFNADGLVDLAISNNSFKSVSILLGTGDGTFTTPTAFIIDKKPDALAAGDFNGDGRLDLVTANTSSTSAALLFGRGDGTFENVQLFEVGLGMTAVAAGDFNGDGKLDLVLGRAASASVSILLGHGDGTFANQVAFSAGAGVSALVVDDLDFDGQLDVATANTLSDDVSILIGHGDGTFADQVRYAVGNNPRALVTGDFNGDGRPDLGVANSLSDSVSILLNLGAGVFSEPQNYAVNGGPTAVVVGDFNLDGQLDLATTNELSKDLSILLGRGDGRFSEQMTQAAAGTPNSLAVGDFNADGELDLASVSRRADSVSVLLGLGDGTFQSPSGQAAGANEFSVATGDFDKDGRLDYVTASFTTNELHLMLGRQDGTFRSLGHLTTGQRPQKIVVGDFNGDGSLDLATANSGSDNVSVFLGQGDGQFADQLTFAVGAEPIALFAGDFNIDGHLDLAVVNSLSNDISVLMGQGDGTFADQVRYAVGIDPKGFVVGDFNEDGRLDLIAVSDDKKMSIMLGRGDGTFAPRTIASTGTKKKTLNAADVNGDGHLDLVTTTRGDSPTISVFLGRGNGSFQTQKSFAVASVRNELTTLDVDQDGRLDLLCASQTDDAVLVFLGNGDGTFHAGANLAVGNRPTSILTADFDGDSRLDLLVGNTKSSDVSLLLNQGAGTFHDQLRTAVGASPVSLSQADFNIDGRLDLVTVNTASNAIEVSLGIGDGTYRDPIATSLDEAPHAVTTEDFNNDGRPDVAVTHNLSNSVSILLSIGDGTFQVPLAFAVGGHPVALVTGDFNHDGIVDIASSDFGTDTVSLLLGRGDGTFEEAQAFHVGAGPAALTVGDLNGDGDSDLIVASSLSRDLTLLIGAGNGTFGSTTSLPLDAAPGAVATGDFNRDGVLDITVTNPVLNTVSILFGRGDGAFQTPVEFATGAVPGSLTVGDFNRDGRADIATANNNSHNVTVLLGQGDGTIPSQTQFDVGRYPAALITGDFNNDGRLDFATANGLAEPISVGLGLGDGTFAKPGASSPTIQSRPLVADLNYDGLLDVVVLRNDGKLLFRASSADGTFRAPVVINTDSDDAVRDVTFLTLDGTAFLVTINSQEDSLDIFTEVDGQFLEVAELAVPGILPSRIMAGDVNGDGLADVVVTSAAAGKVFVYLQRPEDDGSSRPPAYQIDVGNGVSDVALVDVNSDGLPEIVVTDQVSGDVRVLLNSATAPFVSQLRFRAGASLTSVVLVEASQQVQSREMSIAVVAGLFNDDAIPDLAVLNQGVNRVDILPGDGHGGVFNPTITTSLLTGRDPVALVTADFNNDGRADLAVLNKGSDDLSVFLNDGHGGFTEQTETDSAGRMSRISAGNLSTGLSVGDINADGQLDLLIGNEQGDVLTILGNGDGTFRPYQRIDRRVGLAITGLDSDEGPEFAVFDQSQDRITYQSNESGLTFEQGREDGLLAPNAVEFADLNSDGIDDLIVSNGGGNEVFVYLGLHDDQFDSGHHFFVGTDPESITISDLNGDGILDLVVANQGSNDVSLLFGQSQGDDWTLIAGPRLRAGSGPVATAVADLNDDGLVDILVANHDSNDVYLLTGLGRGFFNDKTPVVSRTGDCPVQLFVGHFDDQSGLDVVTLNAGSNDLTIFLSSGEVRTLSTGESTAVSALSGDLDQDGLSDLIVVTSDGQFTLWLGGSNGPREAHVQAPRKLTNVSELVLGKVRGGIVEVYVATENSNVTTLVSFVLNGGSIASPVGVFNAGAFLGAFTSPAAENFVLFGSGSGFVAASTLATEGQRSVNSVVFVLNLDSSSSIAMSYEMGFSDGDSRPMAEFSSPSGSGLEIVPTLTFGFDDASPEVPAWESTRGSESQAAESERMTAADIDAGDLDRNVLITGTAEIPIQQHLNNSADAGMAESEVRFLSPLELFDASTNVATNRSEPAAGDEVGKSLPADDTADQTAQPGEQTTPVFDEDVSSLRIEPGETEVVGASKNSHRITSGPIKPGQSAQPLLDDGTARQFVARLALGSLHPAYAFALAVSLVSASFAQKRSVRPRQTSTSTLHEKD